VEVVEILDDCRSEQVRALIAEHNRGVDFLAAVRKIMVDGGVKNLPPIPSKIFLKRRK
jgi:hypothetical protein